MRSKLANRGNARMWLVSSSTIQKSLAPSINTLAASLRDGGAAALQAAGPRHIDTRLLARDATAQNPVYVGLVAANMKGGVIITSVPSAHFADAGDRNKQLDYLASRLHSGYGAHGSSSRPRERLSYSNGLADNVQGCRVGYYAAHAEIPQTVKSSSTPNPPNSTTPLGDYASRGLRLEPRRRNVRISRGRWQRSTDNQRPSGPQVPHLDLGLRKDANLEHPLRPQ